MTVKIGFFGIVVADMAKSLAFYRAVGLEFPAGADTQPHVDIEIGGGIVLSFDTVETIRSFDPDWSAPHGDPKMGVAFECESPRDVDRRYKELVDAGHTGHKEPWDAFWGQRYSVLRDPDGNDVSLYAKQG